MKTLVHTVKEYVKNDADLVLSVLGGCVLMDYHSEAFGMLREPLVLAGGIAMLSGGYESANRLFRNFYAMAAPIALFWTQSGSDPVVADVANKAIALGCCVASAYLEKRPQSPYYMQKMKE